MLNFGEYYHIYNHANGDENLFRKDENYSFFLRKHLQHISPIAETIAWCLMPNHFHLLIKIKSEEEIAEVLSNFPSALTFPKFQTLEKLRNQQSKFLSKQFSNFFSSYTQAFNKMYDRRGSLFLKNFRRKRIDNKTYLKSLILYIHFNPVHHKFTDTIEQWKWTSYNDFEMLQNDLLESLFGNSENYEQLHRSQTISFEEFSSFEK